MILAAPLFIGAINRVKAVFSGRIGPTIFQPYFDIMRLLRKKCVYSTTTTWVFRASPVLVLAIVLVVAMMVPLGIKAAPVNFFGDILLIAYLLALARFFMIIAALDTGFSMEGMGAAREAFFSCLTEIALFMNFITLAICSKSFSLSRMIGENIFSSWHLLGPAFLLVIGSLFVVMLAENCRIPVDDPDTHLELTMIHEVMILDHSGPDLAYLLYAGAIKLFIFAAVLVPIVVPIQTGNTAIDFSLFIICTLFLAVLVGVVESSMARLRLNRVRGLLLMAFVLAFFGFIVALWRM